jgi:ribosomal protein S18 acetylase RimI-like enzyme
MQLDAQRNFPPAETTLKDGRMVILRLIASDDGEALGDFYDSLPRATWRFYCPPRLTRADAEVKAALASSPTEVCLVSEDPESGEIAGYAWYRWKDATSRTSVFGICLREGYRGAGLGQALMARLLKIAESVGPPAMELTVQLSNPRAVALYTKMGFEIVTEQMRPRVGDFPAEPEYLMERPVRS